MLHAWSDIFHSQYPRCFWPSRWMALVHCTFNFPCCRIVFIPPRCHKLWRFSSSCQKGVKEQFSPGEFHAGKDYFIVTIPNCTSARVLHDLIALGRSLRGQNLSDLLCQICELHHYRLQTICSRCAFWPHKLGKGMGWERKPEAHLLTEPLPWFSGSFSAF